MIKNIMLVVALGAALGGCASGNYSVGNDFAREKVANIEKGETTAQQLKTWFGEPYSKTPISATQSKWMYIHNKGSTKVQSYLVTAKVETTGTQKVLDLLLENDVVVNYTFSEGPTTQMNANGGATSN